MSIEFVTPDMVAVNGYVAEIRDTRAPDIFDVQTTAHNAALQATYANTLQDMEIELHRGTLPLVQIDPVVAAYQQIPRLIDLAQKAANEHAVSYRGFNVGASAYVVSTEHQRAGFLFGGNLTPYKGAPKRCAELEVVTKARQRGFDRVVALATFGPSDFGDVNAVQSPTLHPCAECRTMLDGEPIVPDDTLIITGNEKGDVELMLKSELLALHTPLK